MALVLICLAAGGLAALLVDPWAGARAKAEADAARVAAALETPERINWMLVKDDTLDHVVVWAPDGTLAYPPPEGLVPMRVQLSPEAVRGLAALRRDGTFTRRDGAGVQVISCGAGPPMCLIYDRAELAAALGASPARLQLLRWGGAALGLLAALGLAFAGLRRRAEDAGGEPAFALYPDRYVAVYGKTEVALTQRDLKLLTALEARTGLVVTKDELYDAAWGRDFMPNSRALDQHVINLRRKLDPDKALPTLIETVRGVGYRLVEA
ncbi:MAG: winged helix-turn-helix domain-containing protein [Pseudomonadota bacterium]